MSTTIEYPAYVSRFYDTIYENLRSGTDFQFFNNKILETKGPILDVGVGTGRFFAETLRNGADIYGIDVSENMLNKLKSKLSKKEQERVFLQDVRTLKIPKTFDLIIAPFRVFSHLITIEDQLTALNKIYDHLKSRGKFIFDLFVPNLKVLSEGIKNKIDFDGYYMEGKKLRRIVSLNTDIIKQINHVEMIYIWDENGKEQQATWKFEMRYYFRFELELLIRQSKLKLVNIYGDYNENPLSSNSQDFVIVCEK